MTRLTDAAWLQDAAVQTLLEALGQGEDEARVVGGAIRNHFLGVPFTDVDIATTTLPRDTMRLGAEAGFKPVPTGVDHGTVTLVQGGRAFEVTTLRRDTESDGRHAKVAFGRDWKVDAERRDFTINALYADREGQIYDFVGGLADVETGTLRFIGDAGERIREDYLRSLRFFRFYAWYGRGRPDADALRATARLRDGLKSLSAERVWSEMKKLLSAADPSRALLWMRQAGVLTAVLPETERWGIDTIHPLVQAERSEVWPADPLLRLMAMIPPDGARVTEMARRLRLSNSE
ncbi:MAG: CCA tRNA nucleotidyltransferase, partial [Mesorhizobium sp.]|nr:CCA tRNA nucleotidyltransferase [Mesorhizobium sp.]